MEIREVYLPKPSAIWDKYVNYGWVFLRKSWVENKIIFESIKTDGYSLEEKITAWYHLMVFTEILRAKGLWDKEKNKPIN